MLDRALDERVHPVFQHLGDEGVCRADDEFAVPVRHAFGIPKPGLEGRAGDLQLQLS